MSDDLVTWLRAQLDDDDRVARSASPGPWSSVPTGDGDRIMDGPVVSGYHTAGYVGDEDAEHIARHDPARVLAEVEAKRRILDLYEHRVESMRRYPNQGNANAMAALQEAVRLLALPYADRPGYRHEWKP